MRRLLLLALTAPLIAGCGSSRSVVPDAPERPVPSWVSRENLPPRAVPGATLFASAGCTVCHTYAGYGTSVLGAPDLTSIGLRNLGIQLQIRHLECPACVTPGSPMPKYGSLSKKQLRELAIFLEVSKGTH